MSGRIVVGIDGSASVAAALAWAASEARLRGAELVACSVVERRLGHNDDVSASTATLALEESAGGYPTTALTRHGEPGVELLAASDGADLLVVGSRGRGRLAGSLLGSVSRACVRHARCPVLVTRADRHHRDDHEQASSSEATTRPRRCLLPRPARQS